MPHWFDLYSLSILCFNICDDFWYICYYVCNKCLIHGTSYDDLAIIIWIPLIAMISMQYCQIFIMEFAYSLHMMNDHQSGWLFTWNK